MNVNSIPEIVNTFRSLRYKLSLKHSKGKKFQLWRILASLKSCVRIILLTPFGFLSLRAIKRMGHATWVGREENRDVYLEWPRDGVSISAKKSRVIWELIKKEFSTSKWVVKDAMKVLRRK